MIVRVVPCACPFQRKEESRGRKQIRIKVCYAELVEAYILRIVK